MRIRLLGPIDVVVDGTPRAVRGLRRKAVLAVLALQHGHIVSVARLVDSVWSDNGHPPVANTLQSHVSHLRQVLGSRTSIVARPPGYLLDVGSGDTDVEEAERLIRQGTRSDDSAVAAGQLRGALALWRGSALEDVAGLAWLEGQAERLNQLRAQAVRALLEVRLDLGEHAELVRDLELLAVEHPLDEQIHGQLMLALYRSGRQADALAVFRRLRSALVGNLGVDPTLALRELEAQMLRHDPGLSPPPAPVTVKPATAAGPGAAAVGGERVRRSRARARGSRRAAGPGERADRARRCAVRIRRGGEDSARRALGASRGE